MNTMSVLLVEDKPADVRLVVEAFKANNINNSLSVVSNGEDAVDFLKKKGKFSDAPRPDIVLLDLKIPRKNGHEVLQEIKEDSNLCTIPVIVLSNSDADNDINKSYKYQANCYITKPFKMSEFIEVIKFIERFWLNYVKLPR